MVKVSLCFGHIIQQLPPPTYELCPSIQEYIIMGTSSIRNLIIGKLQQWLKQDNCLKCFYYLANNLMTINKSTRKTPTLRWIIISVGGNTCLDWREWFQGHHILLKRSANSKCTRQILEKLKIKNCQLRIRKSELN